MTDKALNVSKLKVNNRYMILDCLRYSSVSRAELTELTGLAKSTITTLTNEMISQGLLCEAGLAEKSNKAGRTRVLLDINGNFGFAVGINLHRKRISVAAVNIKGEIIFEFSESTSDFKDDIDALESITGELNKKIKMAGLDINRMVGIGVSSPGPIDYKNGIILEPPNFNLFNNYNIVESLKSAYDCPVYLENNAVTLALYEHYYINKLVGSTLFVIISDGIGGALLQNGEIYRGAYGIAGELGHISINPTGDMCACGNRGCLEQYATLSSVKKRFGFEKYEEIIDDVLIGKKEGLEVIDFITETLGCAFVGAVNLFDLERIVLYGEYSYKSELLTNKIESYINEHSVICKAHKVEVTSSGQDYANVSAAAAVPALNGFFKENIA